MLIDAANFRILAVRAELLRSIDRKQHGLPLADVGTKLLAAKLMNQTSSWRVTDSECVADWKRMLALVQTHRAKDAA